MLYYGLLAYVFFEYIRPGQYIPVIYTLKIGTLLPIIVFLLTFTVSNTVSNKEVFRHKNTKWLGFFLSLLIISILTADVTFYAFTKFEGLIGYIFIYFIIAKEINTVRRMKGFFAVMAIVHIIVVSLSPDIILHPETRPYLSQVPFLGDGNDYALSVAIVLPLWFFMIIDEKSKTNKFVFLLIFGLLCISIIGTSSRGGSLALSAVILYLWLRHKKKLRGVIAILVLLWAIVLFAPTSYFQRMDSITDYENESSASLRIMAWKSGIRMAIAHPLLGVGAGHFPVALGTDFRPPEYGDYGGAWITAHSCYFLILGELGFPGIIFLLAVIIGNIRSNEKKIKTLKKYHASSAVKYREILICLNASMIAFAVGGAFLSAVYYPHLYTIAGLFVAGDITYKRLIMNELEALSNNKLSTSLQGITRKPVSEKGFMI